MGGPLLVVISRPDPVASRVAQAWGTLPASEGTVDGAPVRQLGEGLLVLARPGHHIHDEHLDRRLPPNLLARRPTLVFPSVHRSGSNLACLTAHPIGNPGASAEVGGEPRRLVPTDPVRMTTVLRRLAEVGSRLGLPVSFEATHHGPALDVPAFFVEVAVAAPPEAQERAASAIAKLLADGLDGGPGDIPAVGVGGGHYAPRFTDLALRRRWAFGHLLSRHVLVDLDRATAGQAIDGTEGAQGVLYARENDGPIEVLDGLAPRLREAGAPRRADRPTAIGRTASGT